MTHDLRFGLRMIYARRWFAAAIVATLALGIGLNTMVFTLVNAVLFKPVAVDGGDRLVVVNHTHPSRHDPNDQDALSYPDFREYQAHATLFEALEAHDDNRRSLSEPTNPPQSVIVGSVSTGIFEMLHVQPVLGRGLAVADGRAGAEPVAVIGYGLWKDRYGSARDVLGRTVRVDGKPVTIIGVMPEDFKFPNGDEMWIPIVPTPEIEKRSVRGYELFGVLKRGVTIPQAQAELEASVRRMTAASPDTNKDLAAKVQTFHDRYNGGQIRTVFSLMQGAVALVLLIACANVANMMLSRAMERRREISIRAAMGASRWQIVRQMLVECTLLSTLGGILGLALAARRSLVRPGHAGRRQAVLDSVSHGLQGFCGFRSAVCLKRPDLRPAAGAARLACGSEFIAEGRRAFVRNATGRKNLHRARGFSIRSHTHVADRGRHVRARHARTGAAESHDSRRPIADRAGEPASDQLRRRQGAQSFL